jgi:hypothetical protein
MNRTFRERVSTLPAAIAHGLISLARELRFFLTFSLLDVPYIYEGSSRRIFPWGLGGPDSVG